MAEEYGGFRHLSVEIDDAIAVVRLAPAVEQRVEDSFFNDVRDVLAPLSRDDDVDAVLIIGANPRDFMAWPEVSPIKILQEAPTYARAGRLLTVQQIAGTILTFRKPLVAAVNGPIHPIGTQIALMCDAVVAGAETSFRDVHVEMGIAAGDGGTMYWPLLVGVARARDILLMGGTIGAAEALDLRLVQQVVPTEELLSAGVALARRLGDLPRLPFLGTKLAINNWFRFGSLLSWDLAAAYEVMAFGEPDIERAEAHTREWREERTPGDGAEA